MIRARVLVPLTHPRVCSILLFEDATVDNGFEWHEEGAEMAKLETCYLFRAIENI